MSEAPRVTATEPLGEGRYDRFLRATETYRERLVVRLGAEAGLRPAEMCRIRPADVTARVVGGRVHHFLTVREEGGSTRAAYLPSGLKRELDRYTNSDGIDETDPVFDVTPRRLQMLVSEVGSRAARETGVDAFDGVSSADLRHHFGRNLLEEGVDPAVVMAVGGWSRLERLAPTDRSPDREAIARAFDAAGDHGDERFRAAFERLEHPVVLLDPDGVVEHVNHRFERVTGLSSEAAVGRHVGDFLDLPARDRTEMWETALAGETWVDEVGWNVGREDGIAGQLATTAVGVSGGSADGFLLSFRADGTTTPDRVDATGRGQTAQSLIREVSDAVADASTRDEVFDGACRVLAESAAYEFAWASEVTSGGDPDPFLAVGVDTAAIPDLVAGTGRDGTDLAARAAETGSTQAAAIGTEGETAVEADRWLVATPLVHGESVSGVLVVGAPEPPGDVERVALSNLGDRVAGALVAVEWKRLLLADTVLELEFQTDDSDSFFVAASDALGCTLRVEGLVPLGGGSLLYYVTVSGASPERALEVTGGSAESVRLIADHSDECLLEVTTDSTTVASALIDRGANIKELVAEGSQARIVCEMAPSTDVRAVAEALSETAPSASLVAKREVDSPVRTQTEFQRSLEERLTDKQLSVLQAAYHAGYFDWPRGSTAEELADSIGVSSPTLHNHLRRGQRKLLSAFFDDDRE